MASLITKKITPAGGKKLRVRADTFGYLQRSFPGFVSESDATEARLVGKTAVQYSADEKNIEGSVAMRRASGSEYKIETFLTPLSTVARETKHMDPSYVRPLVGKLPIVGTFDELKRS
jgi:6-phosphofructokinase 1